MKTDIHYLILEAGQTACKLVYRGPCPYAWTRARARVTCRQCSSALNGRS